MGLAIWNCFVIPIEVSFNPEVLDFFLFYIIDSFIDLMFLLDIFINFRTSYVNHYTGEEVLYLCDIAKNYLSGRFWIDLLATIPFDLIGVAILGGGASELELFGILKLVRIARLSKIISYLNVKEDVKLVLKLAKLIFFLLMYLHLLGCSWYFVVKHDKDWIPPLDYVYVTTTFFEDDTHYKYWMSVYHAVLVLTGNDIGPRFKTFQVIFCTMFVTFGAIVNAYIFGELVVILTVMNAKTAQFVEKLDICNTAMKNQHLPRQLQHEVIGYLTYTQALLTSQQELETFLGLISPSLREKVIKYIFTNVLQENPVLGKNKKLIDYITPRLTTNIFQPEEKIVSQGEAATKIFFIAKGGCHVYIQNRNNEKVKVNTLVPGDLFGEVAIINGCNRTATVTANNYSTIAYLEKDEFYLVFSKYPDEFNALKEGRKNYQDEWKVFLKENLKFFSFIKNCRDETVEELTYYLRDDIYNAGDMIFSAGSQIDKTYFIANGEVEILVKIGHKEVILDVLYQACNIGEYGILGDFKHTFSGRAKKNGTHMVYLTKQSLEKCRIKFPELYSETERCREYLEQSGLPLVDFRLYRPYTSIQNSVEILKLAIARIMRINHALDANYSPEEITEILQKIQINVVGEEGSDDDLQKNSNKMLAEVLQRLNMMSQENQELKLQISKFNRKIEKIEDDVSMIKSEVIRNPPSDDSSIEED
uniref:Cyclic nucleotide-binding domain-containing protein n=1 Tax=Euplotes crassus TaxID=5936 RepID=A0A7S3K652_EUPCR|mmetsp:Transcript_11798/g.11764  ORF Transcript_11798/g.11764 Transcript_11798/m.11764 type:complete len:703 (+) Transcript_11798:488-2596(+)